MVVQPLVPLCDQRGSYAGPLVSLKHLPVRGARLPAGEAETSRNPETSFKKKTKCHVGSFLSYLGISELAADLSLNVFSGDFEGAAPSSCRRASEESQLASSSSVLGGRTFF